MRLLMKKELLRFFLFPLILIIVVSFSFADKIHLKNGYTISGEIISSDATTVTIKAPLLGIMEISRDKISSIEPPLEVPPEEKEPKKELSKPQPPEPEVEKPARGEIFPQSSKPKNIFQKPKITDFLGARRQKKRLSVYLSGGLTEINGGDLNGVIRDYKQLISDYNDFYLTSYTADWTEFERITNWKGEVLVNITSSISFGLGVEYLYSKIQRGSIVLNDSDSGTVQGGLYYYNYTLSDNYQFAPQQELTVIPITFNLYYFIPIGNIAEVFFKAGVSYNIGKLRYNESYQSDYQYQADYYASDDTFWYTYLDNYTEDGTYSYEVKSNETGVQVGLGLEIKPLRFISLVVEGTYRNINFKNWNGSGSDDWSFDEQWGRSDLGYSTDSGNESDAWSGKIYYYELYDSDLDKQYGFLSLHETPPQVSEFIKNPRVGKINLDGFSLRAGIRISF
jgi:opacity protein-like surface antigen/sRNA-binding regulator protein Hfq